MRLAALFFFLAGTACHKPPPPPPAVASIGADRVLASDLKAELDRLRTESEEQVKLEGDQAIALRRAVLSDMIDHRLLLAEAARQNVSVTDKEVDDVVAKRQAAGAARESGTDGLPPDIVRQRTREELIIERYLLRDVASRVALGPDDARTYYDAHQDQYKRGEEIRVSQILVTKRNPVDLDAKKQAEALRVMLNRTDFAKLAREQSAGPEADKGGDLGWFGHGQMPPELDVCFQMRKGQISDVVETQYGFHIFKLVDRHDARTTPFNEVANAIELELKRDAVAKAEAASLARLRQKADVKIFDAEIQKLM